ncbi:pseudomonapepsin [Aliidongia dinghuensis]|uniref:Pseudomonapepsin n=2 Tax=Aliidongia dinghuensis TaxID=1867774 RepID=A0A8J2YYM4_9PROT|nr:pseudomonapepsin [Aliidongia dinghuensis]
MIKYRHSLAVGALLSALVPLAATAGELARDQRVEFDIALNPRNPETFAQLLTALSTPGSSQYGHWLTPEQYTREFGTSNETLAAVTAELSRAGLTVLETHAHGLHVAGRAADVGAAFSLRLQQGQARNGSARVVASGQPVLTPALAAAGARIVAFDNFERMRAFARPTAGGAKPQNATSPTGGYWATDLKQAYDGPSYQALTGQGRTIAILMSGDVQTSDIQSYFSRQGLAMPSLTRIAVNGGATYSASNDGSFEATLDVEQAGGMAPKAQILLYLIPDLSDANILAGLSRIVSDNKADIVSLSFGGCEKFYTAAYNGGHDASGALVSYEQVFERGNAQGITFVVASGDEGGLQCPAPAYFSGKAGQSWLAGASAPAVSPAVTAVGGTNLVTSYIPGSTASTYVSENAYGDPLTAVDPYGIGVTLKGGYWGSGGGPSVYFKAPSWQSLVKTGTSMRATPDMALQMGGCPSDAKQPCGANRSYVIEIFAGQAYGAVGTSASTPAFAGVLALWEQKLGNTRLGNVNPVLYQAAKTEGLGGSSLKPFRQRIAGYNGVYTSTSTGSTPYNMVVGNGTVDIRQLINGTSIAAAGNPGTASNP